MCSARGEYCGLGLQISLACGVAWSQQRLFFGVHQYDLCCRMPISEWITSVAADSDEMDLHVHTSKPVRHHADGTSEILPERNVVKSVRLNLVSKPDACLSCEKVPKDGEAPLKRCAVCKLVSCCCDKCLLDMWFDSGHNKYCVEYATWRTRQLEKIKFDGFKDFEIADRTSQQRTLDAED